MSPRIVDKEAKKRQIVQAAMSVFARQGFNNTKIIDIAQAASVGKGTIYEYFRSKDEIFLETFTYFQHEMEGEVARRIYLVTDPREKIKILVRTWFDGFVKFADFGEVMLDFWAEGIQKRHEKIDLKALYAQYRGHIVSMLDEGVQAGVFKPMNLIFMASAILGAMDGLMIQWILEERQFPLVEAGEEFTQSILNGIEA